MYSSWFLEPTALTGLWAKIAYTEIQNNNSSNDFIFFFSSNYLKYWLLWQNTFRSMFRDSRNDSKCFHGTESSMLWKQAELKGVIEEAKLSQEVISCASERTLSDVTIIPTLNNSINSLCATNSHDIANISARNKSSSNFRNNKIKIRKIDAQKWRQFSILWSTNRTWGLLQST